MLGALLVATYGLAPASAPASASASARATGAAPARAATAARTWYHRETIGRSAGGRPIVAYRAGQRGRPVVVVLSVLHGDEPYARHVSLGLLRGRRITGVDLWVVPVANPDGYAHDRRWLSGGVDPNRNFPDRWVRQPHAGPRAASAVETRALMRFLDRVRPRYVVSWHQPLFGVDSYRVKDRALMRRLSSGLDLPVRRFDCRGGCHGTLTDWFNATHRGAAITVEYGSRRRSVARMEGRDAKAVLAAVGGRRG